MACKRSGASTSPSRMKRHTCAAETLNVYSCFALYHHLLKAIFLRSLILAYLVVLILSLEMTILRCGTGLHLAAGSVCQASVALRDSLSTVDASKTAPGTLLRQ